MSLIRLCLNNCSVICDVMACTVSDTYWAHCVTLAYLQACHILSPSVYRTGDLFKTLRKVDQVYSKPCQGIIQPFSDIFRTLRNTCICRNLGYPKSWNVQNLSILHPDAYSELCHIYENLQMFLNSDIFKIRHMQNRLNDLKWSFFSKIVENSNCFSKVLHLRFLTGFWICL